MPLELKLQFISINQVQLIATIDESWNYIIYLRNNIMHMQCFITFVTRTREVQFLLAFHHSLSDGTKISRRYCGH